jgi:5-methylcytosine-specific restriction protein A
MGMSVKIKHDRMYDNTRWRKASRHFLAMHPLCSLCARMGRDTAASIVDHIIPHQNNIELFWDQDNWQSVCASCHSGIKRTQEHYGYSQAAGIDGQPIDRNHPWNR